MSRDRLAAFYEGVSVDSRISSRRHSMQDDEDGAEDVRLAVRQAMADLDAPMPGRRARFPGVVDLEASEAGSQAGEDADEEGGGVGRRRRGGRRGGVAAEERGGGAQDYFAAAAASAIGEGIGDALSGNKPFDEDEWMYDDPSPPSSAAAVVHRPRGGAGPDEEEGGGGDPAEEAAAAQHDPGMPDGDAARVGEHGGDYEYCYLCWTEGQRNPCELRGRVLWILSYYNSTNPRLLCEAVKRFYDARIRVHQQGREWTLKSIWRHLRRCAGTTEFHLWWQMRTQSRICEEIEKKLQGEINPVLIKTLMTVHAQMRATIATMRSKGRARGGRSGGQPGPGTSGGGAGAGAGGAGGAGRGV